MRKFLEEGCYYELYNKKTEEKSIGYFYFHPDLKVQGFGFNHADGSGFLCLNDLNKDTACKKVVFVEAAGPEIKEEENVIVITPRDILSAFASCIIKQSPYVKIDNLVEILEDIRLHLITLGYPDENECVDKYHTSLYIQKDSNKLYNELESIRDNVKSFSLLNVTKKELDNGIIDANDPNRSTRIVFTSRYSHTKRDSDFIDLDACIRNVYNKL